MSGYTLSGGPSSLAARLDDMDRWAECLERVATELRFLIAEAIGDDLADSGGRVFAAVLAPATAAGVEYARLEFHAEATRVAAIATITAEALPAATLAYRRAEEGAAEAFRSLWTTAGYGLGVAAQRAGLLLVFSPAGLMGGTWLVGGGAAAIALLGGDRRDAAGRGLVRVVFEKSDAVAVGLDAVIPGFVAGFFGFPHPGLPFPGQPPWPTDARSLARAISDVGPVFGLFREREVEVTELDRSSTHRARPPADPAELFDRTVAQHRGKDSGEVRIEEVVGADGQTRWIVYLPATTDWSPVAGEDVTDLTTNVRGVAGRETAVRQMVYEAMAEQGIRPGEEVMLAGYSQGGITAASLAADPRFTSRYNVTALVTTGSPVSGFDVGPGVEVLSLENEGDLVPDLDGGERPDRANWTTVTGDLSLDRLRELPMFEGKTDAEIREAASQPGFWHTSEVYSQTWRALGEGGQSSAFAASQAGFFAGTVVGTRDYGGARKPPKNPGQ